MMFKIVRNTSWGENEKITFGDKPGYLILDFRDRLFASISGLPHQNDAECRAFAEKLVNLLNQ